MSFKHTFTIDPVAKGRPRLGKYGTFTPAKTRRFETAIKLMAKKSMLGGPIEGPLHVSVVFEIKKPMSSKNDHPIVRPDVDNFAKGLLDALNGIFWNDDSQIVSLFLKKTYKQSGSIIVEIIKI